jgi:hypothetical protein
MAATLLTNAILEDNLDWATNPTVANLEATDANVASGGTTDNPIVRVGFDMTTETLNDGADLQSIEVYAAMTRDKTGVPTIHLELYENGSTLGVTVGPVNLTSTTHTAFELTFNSSILSGDGTDVELRVTGTAGGSGGQRNGVAVDSIIWYADSSPVASTDKLFFGALDILDMRVGTVPVLEVYFGTTLVWTAPSGGGGDAWYTMEGIQHINIPAITLYQWAYFEIEADIRLDVALSTGPYYVLGSTGGADYLRLNADGSVGLGFGVHTFVSTSTGWPDDGLFHTIRVEGVAGTSIEIFLDNVSFYATNNPLSANATWHTIGSTQTTVGRWKGAIKNVLLTDQSVLQRTYVIEDGWVNNPDIVDTTNSQTGTAIGFTQTGWD